MLLVAHGAAYGLHDLVIDLGETVDGLGMLGGLGASSSLSADNLQTYDLFFRSLFVLVIIELDSRRLVHYGATRNPAAAWVAQQLREATPFSEGPRFLIRDNDNKLGEAFARVGDGTGIEALRTPYGAPKADAAKLRAVCERFLGSVRRECLDQC